MAASTPGTADSIEDAAGQRVPIERVGEAVEIHVEHQRRLSHALLDLSEYIERLGETAVVAQIDRLQAFELRHRGEQAPAVAVDVEHAAVEPAKNPFDRPATPLL